MDHWIVQFGTVFMAFFAIMNPVANTPVFLGVTEELDEAVTDAQFLSSFERFRLPDVEDALVTVFETVALMMNSAPSFASF